MSNIKLAFKSGTNKASKEPEIIYDTEKARLHKNEMDSAVAKFKEETAKHDKRLRIAGICAGVVWTVALVVTKLAGWVIALGFASAFPIGFFVGVQNWCREQSKPSDKYTPDILYYLAIDGKKILHTKITPYYKYIPNVTVTVENSDHSVSETEINFEVVTKTDLDHIILNVNEGVIYAPYED